MCDTGFNIDVLAYESESGDNAREI